MIRTILAAPMPECKRLLPCLSGLELLYVAGTYSELQHVAERCLPELIIVDASLEGLPPENGLQQLRKNAEEAQILLITSDCDFCLAHDAIAASVSAILHRPVEEAELRSCLDEILLKLRRTSRTHYTGNLSEFVGQLFLNHSKELLPEKLPEEETVNMLYSTRFRQDGYRLLSMCTELGSAFDVFSSTELMQACIVDILEKIQGMCHEVIYYTDDMRAQMLINYQREKDAELLRCLEEVLSSKKAALPEDVLITFCCSQIHDQIRQIQQMQDEASNAMWMRLTKGMGLVILSSQEPPCPSEMQQIYDLTERKLKSACSILDYDTFEKTLHSFFSLPDSIVGRTETRKLIRNIEYYLQEANRDVIISFTSASRARREIILSLRTANTLENYKQQYTLQLTTLFQQIILHGQKSKPIRLAQEYMKNNYAKPLKLSDVAAQVGLNPSYLSALFKKETGVGFSDYLTRCRIDAAKNMLCTTQEKINTISAYVGFSNPRYFSRVFREAERIKPSDYRAVMSRKK
ncbi:MAG: helix-turn-helix domain-containing protein [Faecousia sp.]